MPNPGLAANAAVFGGAVQGMNASDFYRQQLQASQLDAALKRQALLGQLQQMQQQQGALAAAPKEEQQFLNLGGTVTDWQKRQDLSTQANAIADQMYQGAMDQSKPAQERMDLFQRSAQLRAHPELAQLPQFQKYGEPSKAAAQPFKTFTADGKVNAFEGYNPDGTPKISPMGAAPASTKQTRHYYDAADPTTGVSMVHERIEDASGNLVSDEPIARGKLGAMQQQQVTAVSQAEEQAQGLNADYAKIKPKFDKNGSSWLLYQWSLYSPSTNPGGIRGEPDPDAAQWFSHVGQIKAGLLQAAAGNSRNLTMVNNLFGPHVPSEWQSPDGVMTRINAFQKDGRFDAIRDSILGPLPSSAASASSGGTGSGTWTGKLSPDGREVWKNPDGTMYLK